MVALCAPVFAFLRLPPIFGDNMVLQVGPRTPVYGHATPREVVRIRLGSHLAMAQANQHGNWRVEFNLPKSEGPIDLSVADSEQTVSYHNVLVGEVWICSGQSNMEWSRS